MLDDFDHISSIAVHMHWICRRRYLRRDLNNPTFLKLHDAISKQNMTREEIIAERNAMFPENPY